MNLHSLPRMIGSKLWKQYSTNSTKNNFVEMLRTGQIMLSLFQKTVLILGFPLHFFLVNHKRADLLACIGELTSSKALQSLITEMRSHPEGQTVLKETLLLNSQTVDFDHLQTLSKNSLGYNFAEFMIKFNISLDDRPPVRFIADPELAYVMTRYRQTHDLVHTITDLPPTKLGEIGLKLIESAYIEIPLVQIAAVFGPLLMNKKQLSEYKTFYFPWALSMRNKLTTPLMFLHWEKRWAQDIKDLRKELGIETFKKINIK